MTEQKKDLTVSQIDRQNILNNPYAVEEIEKAAGIKGIQFEGKHVVMKEQVASFFGVSARTIDNCIAKNERELAENGYVVLKGNRLKLFKEAVLSTGVSETDFVNLKVAPQIGIFDVRAFLNIAMLLTESNQAQLMRQMMLDIVIDTINQRTGGEDFLESWFAEENYRKQFTDALRDYVAMGNFKYPNYTNKVYEAIFKENAEEYRKILNLEKADKTRDTFYSEVLDLVSAFECGFAEELQKEYEKKGSKLTNWEADELFDNFKSKPHWRPLVEKARNKMARRDHGFRGALHLKLKEYITPLGSEDFERFIGEKSKALEERLKDAEDVIKRLKDR